MYTQSTDINTSERTKPNPKVVFFSFCGNTKRQEEKKKRRKFSVFVSI